MTFVEIDDGYFVNAEAVTVVKAINDKRCSLWVRGQSSMDGFVVERNARELLDEIIAACYDDGDDDIEDEPDEDE